MYVLILGQFYEWQVLEKFSYMILCLIKELGLGKYAKKGWNSMLSEISENVNRMYNIRSL